MNYARQAQDETAMRTLDVTGSLPLHTALHTRAPLGSIKLLVKGNSDAIDVPDGSGIHPLNIACQYSTVGVVKYLAENSSNILNSHRAHRNPNTRLNNLRTFRTRAKCARNRYYDS